MTDLTNTAPKRIYLDIGDQFALERVASGDLRWDLLEGVTWSEDNATSHGIPYVRADLVPTPAASGAAPALPTDAMIHAAAHAFDVSNATFLVKMRCALSAALARQEAAPAKDGYATAFYEIASVLGIGARADTPENVFRNEMLPRIVALASREAGKDWSETEQSALNDWFLALPEGRRKALLEGDRWMLAGAAFLAGRAAQPASPAPLTVGERAELDQLRLLAGGNACIPEVQRVLGPISLWSAQALQDHIDREVAAALASPQVAPAPTFEAAFMDMPGMSSVRQHELWAEADPGHVEGRDPEGEMCWRLATFARLMVKDLATPVQVASTKRQPTEDDEMTLIESQIDGILEGEGAGEDHANVKSWIAGAGLRESLVCRVHRAISCFERDHLSKPEAAPVAPQPTPYVDSNPQLHVGESSFEDWYQNYLPNSVGHKQIARDAYAAGMGDPLVAPQDDARDAAEGMRSIGWTAVKRGNGTGQVFQRSRVVSWEKDALEIVRQWHQEYESQAMTYGTQEVFARVSTPAAKPTEEQS